MKYNLSYVGRKKPVSNFINNNNYMTFLLGDNLKNIKINYNLKGNDSYSNLFQNNKPNLNWNLINNFNSKKFEQIKPNTSSHNFLVKLAQNSNISNRFFKMTKDNFFRKKDISNIPMREEEKLKRNLSAKNIKRAETNSLKKNNRDNQINMNNNKNNINYYLQYLKKNNSPINNRILNNINKNFTQFINYENMTKNNRQKYYKDNITQHLSRNKKTNTLSVSLINPPYISYKNNINDNISNLYIKKNIKNYQNNSTNNDSSDFIKNKTLIKLISPQNQNSSNISLKQNKTPIYKIKKNILKTIDLPLTKKLKLSSINTREKNNTKDIKVNSEISFSINNKDSKDIIQEKNVKEIIKGYNAVSQAGNNKNFFKKINQDCYIAEININGIKNFNIFGVLDGHGLYGHLISLFVGKYIMVSFMNNEELKECSDVDELYFKLKRNNFGLINEIFVNAEKELYNQEFDSNFSGTTCIIVIQVGENLICANSGDSRAILIYNDTENLKNNNSPNKIIKEKESETNFYQIKNIIAPFSSFRNNTKKTMRANSCVDLFNFTNKNSLKKTFKKSEKIFRLSNDLKPTLPLERKRIEESGGKVEKYVEKDGTTNGPYRVWVLNEMYPGLAMSRSIGDFIASSVGVIPNPEIIEYSLNKSSKYMIIASDGIWQFMSNEKVMSIANKYYPKKDPIDMCNDLVREANACWEKEGIPRDDITVLVVYF